MAQYILWNEETEELIEAEAQLWRNLVPLYTRYWVHDTFEEIQSLRFGKLGGTCLDTSTWQPEDSNRILFKDLPPKFQVHLLLLGVTA
jgi:hypothetical protein